MESKKKKIVMIVVITVLVLIIIGAINWGLIGFFNLIFGNLFLHNSETL